MAGEVAKFFATLGFKVDETGLKKFEAGLASLHNKVAMVSRNMGVMSTKVGEVKRKVDALNKSLNKDSTATKGKGATEAYSKMATYVGNVEKAQTKLTNTIPRFQTQLSELRKNVWKGSNAWEAYAKNIAKAKAEMSGFRSVAGMQKTGRITVNNRTSNYNGGGYGGYRPPINQQSDSGGMTIIGGLAGGFKDFFRSMTPATAIAGGAVTAGFLGKELVQAGNEVMKMRNIVLMGSKGDADALNHNMKYIKETTKEMGVSYTEFGRAYGSMLMATADSPLLDTQKEKMFKNLSQYMVSIGQSEDDQKGTFRALTQMFTKGKVQAEEMLQMAERGIPASSMIKKAAMEAYKIDSAGYEKLQQKGGIDPSKVLPKFAEMLAKIAKDSGAYDKAINSNIAGMGRLKNAWQQFADVVMSGGGDSALGGVFNRLADLLIYMAEPLSTVVFGIGKLVEWCIIFGKWIKNNFSLTTFFTALTTVIGLTTASMIALGTGSVFTAGAIGLVTKALSLLGKRIVVLLAITWALYQAFKALKEHNSGKYTWISYLIHQFTMLGLKVENVMLRFQLLWAYIKNYGSKVGDFIERSSPDIENGFSPKSSQQLRDLMRLKLTHPRTSDTTPIPKTGVGSNMTGSVILKLEGNINGQNIYSTPANAPLDNSTTTMTAYLG